MRYLVLLPILLVGCTTYKKTFDCAASPGVGCQSVSTIENQILEYDQGPDWFIPIERSDIPKPYAAPAKLSGKRKKLLELQ